MKREFVKYVWYALGEIALVIAGIIIALQIDSWHENNQKQERLDNFFIVFDVFSDPGFR